MTTTEQRPMTAKQEKVLEFIRANSGLYGPTVREIALAFSIRSPNGVVCHLKALEKKGLIKRTPHSSRGIEVVR
jgi:repressor LexA